MRRVNEIPGPTRLSSLQLKNYRSSFSIPLMMCALPLSFSGFSDLLINFFAFHPQSGSQVIVQEFDPAIREIFFEAHDGVKLQAFFVPRPDTDRVVLFLHGNAGNASFRLPHARQIADLGTNVFLLSYRGYGKSEGSPSEQGVYIDGQSALDYLETQLGFSKDRTILFGRSLGSAVAVEISQKVPLAGLVLVSPMTSGQEMAQHLSLSWLSWLIDNPFNSANKIQHIKAPVLIIHGEEDHIIPVTMGRKLFEVCPSPKELKVVPGADHNDLIRKTGPQFWSWIQQFLHAVAPLG